MNETPVSSRCEEILHKREHVLVGVSPLNSYYSEANILTLLKWAKDNFSSFHILTADTLFKKNFLALGYTELKSLQKTRSHWNLLKNKILRCLSSLGYSQEESLEKIIAMNGKLPNSPAYSDIKDRFLEKFNTDKSFKELCLESSKEVLKSYSKNVDSASLEIAANYLLEEIPFYIDTPAMLNVPSSLMVYHRAIPFFTSLYKERKNNFISFNQGHLIAEI